MEKTFKSFVEESNSERIEKLILKLEVEEDRSLEDLIIKLSTLIV